MIAYLDTPSGISGDMFLGCLIDAGWPLAALQEVVGRLGLPVESWHIEVESVMRGPLRATLAVVDAAEGPVHRHLSDIRAIIDAADLSQGVKDRAMAVFTRLAEAEADVHGMAVESVHFHEVGAVDAIIDIVGVCAGLAALGIEELCAGPLPLGPGWTQSAHGRIPLPAPATLNLLAAVGAPTRPAPGPGELVTPTGAALLCELATFTQPTMTVQKIATGAGQKEFEWPNIARLWLGEAAHLTPKSWGENATDHVVAEQASPRIGGQGSDQSPTLVQLATNIDDMNPELYGYVADKLFDAGALDVWTTPIQMKKQRPGTLLSVLARADREQSMADILLRETTTLGVRVHHLRRHETGRRIETIETPLGSARVKLKFLDGQLSAIAPEHDDCRALAETHNIPLRDVYNIVQNAAKPITFHESRIPTGAHHD